MCAFSLSFPVRAAQRGPSGWLELRSHRFHRFPRTDSSNSKTPLSRREERWRLARMPRSSTSIWISPTLTGTIWKTQILRKLILAAAVPHHPLSNRRDSLTPRSTRRSSVKMATFLSALPIWGRLLGIILTRITFLSPLISGWFIIHLLREITSSRSSRWDPWKKLNKTSKEALLSNKTTFSLLISARYSPETTRPIKVFRDNACLKIIYSEIAMIIKYVDVKKSSFFTRDQDRCKPLSLRIPSNHWNLADSPLSNNSSSKTWEDRHLPPQDRITSPSWQARSWCPLWLRDSVTSLSMRFRQLPPQRHALLKIHLSNASSSSVGILSKGSFLSPALRSRRRRKITVLSLW